MNDARRALAPALIFAAACGAGCARRPCGIIRSEQDPFAGPTREFAIDMRAGEVGMSQAKGTSTVRVIVWQDGLAHDVVAAGDKVQLAVGDRVLALAAKKEAQPVAQQSGNAVYTKWTVDLDPSPDDLQAITSAPLTAVKLPFGGDKDARLILDDGDGARFQSAAACLIHGAPK